MTIEPWAVVHDITRRLRVSRRSRGNGMLKPKVTSDLSAAYLRVRASGLEKKSSGIGFCQ